MGNKKATALQRGDHVLVNGKWRRVIRIRSLGEVQWIGRKGSGPTLAEGVRIRVAKRGTEPYEFDVPASSDITVQH